MLLSIILLALFSSAAADEFRSLLEAGRYAEALQKMQAQLRASPEDPKVQYQIGEILREQAEFRAARLAELAPDSAEALLLSGRAMETSGKLDQALTVYKSALIKKPKLPGAHFLIGNIYWKQRELEAARTEFQDELQGNPNHSLANLRLAQVLMAMNEPALAAEHARRAVTADDSLMEAHQALAKAAHSLGRNSEALREYQIVAARRPRDGSVHFQLATVYRSLGKADAANAELEIHRRLLQEKAEAARRASPASAR